MPILIVISDGELLRISDFILAWDYGYWGILIASALTLYFIKSIRGLEHVSVSDKSLESNESHYTKDNFKSQSEVNEKIKDKFDTTTKMSKEAVQKFTEDLSKRDLFEKMFLAIGAIIGLVAIVQVYQKSFISSFLGFVICGLILLCYFKISLRIKPDILEALYAFQENTNLVFESKLPTWLSSEKTTSTYVLAILAIVRYFIGSYNNNNLFAQIVIFISIVALPLLLVNCIVAFVRKNNELIWKVMLILVSGHMINFISGGLFEEYTYFSVYSSVNALTYWIISYWVYQYEQFFSIISNKVQIEGA
jgi:hypothetical protein